MGMSGSPTPINASPFLPNLSSISSLPISSLRPNIPSELYVSALTNSSGLAPLLPGTKGTPSPSSAISPTVKPSLLPSAPQSLTAPNLLAGRGARSHGSRGGLHGHSGGRIKQLPTWMDAPDDLFFHSTQVTKWVRRSPIVSRIAEITPPSSSHLASVTWRLGCLSLVCIVWLKFTFSSCQLQETSTPVGHTRTPAGCTQTVATIDPS